MEDDLWSEIQDMPGEIFDIEDLKLEDYDQAFNRYLNSNYDY